MTPISTNIGEIKVKLEFEFTTINNRLMTVKVNCDSRHWVIQPKQPGIYDLEFDVTLPNSLLIEFSGKNNQTDTQVDADGNILADLCVKVKSITLDRIPIKINTNKLVILETDSGASIQSNYIGFNGRSVIPMEFSNAFEQIMFWQKNG